MSQTAIDYIKANKDKYSKEVLIEQLRKTGYSEVDIEESAAIAYAGTQFAGNNLQAVSAGNFWDFKSKRTYTKPSEKQKDFLFGFFAPWFLGIVSSIIPFIGNLIVIVGGIFAIIYFFNRRRFISYGLLANIATSLVVVGIFIVFIFSRF